jgi:chromosome segregation ATPase
MRVSELELELEGVNAEAIARRQEITDAEAQISALTEDLHAALADRLAAEQALTDAKRELNQLAAMVDENRTTADSAQAAAATASEAIAAAEQRAIDAESRVGELEYALASAVAERDQIAGDLQQITATATEQAGRLASIADDLEACRVNVASADTPSTPTPAQTPSRSSAITTPNIVTTPDPASSNSGGNGSSIDRAGPRQLDAMGIQTLRMMQQATLRQNAVNQRRSWATQDGRYTGFVMVLYEGYQGPDFCREIYSEARADGYLVHESTERFCQRNGYWEYQAP